MKNLKCGCIVRENNTYKKKCLHHVKTLKPNVSGLAGKQTNSPYTCLRCENKVGFSWVEPKHDCNNPMFDKNGNINEKMEAVKA